MYFAAGVLKASSEPWGLSLAWTNLKIVEDKRNWLPLVRAEYSGPILWESLGLATGSG